MKIYFDFKKSFCIFAILFDCVKHKIMEKKNLTDTQKIKKFLIWIKNQKSAASDYACGSGSSWNWAYYEAMEKAYDKAKSVFKMENNL